MMMGRELAWCALLATTMLLMLLAPSAQASDAVMGCQGVVEWPSDVPGAEDVDFTVVSVCLLNRGGVEKERISLLPNGHYFLRAMQSGVHVLQLDAPEGWSFDPPQMTVDIQSNGECVVTSPDHVSRADFVFRGFHVGGKVVGSGAGCDANGPQGVTVELTPVDSSSPQKPIVTVTEERGLFSFSNVLPGAYSVSARHDDWQVRVVGEHSSDALDGQQRLSFEVRNDNVVLPSAFRVTGYRVMGRVRSADAGVKGVSVALVSVDDHQQVEVVTTNDDGLFVFQDVACGAYEVRPPQSESTTFTLEPERLPLTVDNRGDQDLRSTTFEVTGFTVSGKAQHEDGRGIAGVDIYVGDRNSATTDKDGHFRLQIASGVSTIHALKPHLFFNSLKGIKVSPSLSHLPPLTVTHYHVCGSIALDNAGDRLVQLLSEDSSTVVSERRTSPKGAFCFKAKSGSYVVSPVLTPQDARDGIILKSSGVLTVNHDSILELSFVPVRVSISGSVRCLEQPCDPSISVTLSSVTSDFRSTIGLGGAGSLVAPSPIEPFAFRDVLPGRYVITIQQDALCWEQKTMAIDTNAASAADRLRAVHDDEALPVGAGEGAGNATAAAEPHDVVGVQFVQKGYGLQSVLSHDIDLDIFLINDTTSALVSDDVDSAEVVRQAAASGAKVLSFELSKGHNRFCVRKSGVYALVPRSCYRFAKTVYTFDTSHPDVLYLTASHFRVTGSVRVHHGPGEALPRALPVRVRVRGADAHSERSEVVTAYSGDTADAPAEAVEQWPHAGALVTGYAFTWWAELGDEAVITLYNSDPNDVHNHPVDDVSALLPQHMAYPPHGVSLRLTHPVCSKELQPIVLRKGLWKTGRITPGESGIEVTVTEGESGEVVAQGRCDGEGRYRLGPLDDTRDYHVSVRHPGYAFVAHGNGDFGLLKFGQINITCADADNEVLSGVLVSLSSRTKTANALTNGEGLVSFEDVVPEDYYVRPSLKEYSFAPEHLRITIHPDGTNRHQTGSFVARRVAFSAFGRVSSLNGQPEIGVHVEAIDVTDGVPTEDNVGDHVVEDAVTVSPNGAYRLRGLIPSRSYWIRVRHESSRVERQSPERHVITHMQSKDVQQLDFVVFRPPKAHRLMGHVSVCSSVPQEVLNGLRASVYSASVSKDGPLSANVPLDFEDAIASDVAVHPFFSLQMPSSGPFWIVLRSSIDDALWHVNSSALYVEPSAAPYAVGEALVEAHGGAAGEQSSHTVVRLRWCAQRRETSPHVSASNAAGMCMVMVFLAALYNLQWLRGAAEAWRSGAGLGAYVRASVASQGPRAGAGATRTREQAQASFMPNLKAKKGSRR